MATIPPGLTTIAQRREVLEGYLQHFNDRVTDLANQLHSGSLSASAWETAMRAELKDLHTSALVISYGGDRSAISYTEWGRLGGHIRVQYQYLHRYAEQVQASAVSALQGGKFFSEKYLAWRSQLYGGNARASFYRGLAQGLLPQVPGDGQTQCRTNCACHLVFEEGDEPGLLLVYWQLGEAEHCDDCVDLSHEWNPYELWLPVGLSAGDWALWLPQVRISPLVL